MVDLHSLLKQAVTHQASDLHLSTGLSPRFRIDGELVSFDDNSIQADSLYSGLIAIMTEQQQQNYDQHGEEDFAYTVPDLARFRVNVFQQIYGPAAVFRVIPNQILDFTALGAPAVFTTICQQAHGLVLVTGPTGSGKSTTMSAMIDYINQQYQKHIITIEHPVEFIHQSNQCLINQREVGQQTKNFSSALRAALREDPDIILIGEMRDIESIRLAITAAETGHLVISTLHTNSAVETIDRIINVFPAGEQQLIRYMLANSLQAVIAQNLLKKPAGGRIAAYEIMLANPAIRHLIRDNKTTQITSVMQTNQAEGMITKERYINQLRAGGLLS